MIEYVNFILLLAIIFAITYPCYKLRKIFYMVMDSKILDQLTNLEQNFSKELKPKRNGSRKKKIEQPLIEEPMEEEVDPEKRNRLINCVLSGIILNNI